MDVRLAVASKRDHRDFAERPLPEAVLTEILDAGRLAGSARNRQPWRFAVATAPDARARLAACVYVPRIVMSAPAAVALVVDASGSALWGFDAGRAAQNMMLAAWSEGVASCPNGIRDPAAAAEAVGAGGSEVAVTVVAFGYPRRPRDPARRTADEWSDTARRRPLADVAVRL